MPDGSDCTGRRFPGFSNIDYINEYTLNDITFQCRFYLQ